MTPTRFPTSGLLIDALRCVVRIRRNAVSRVLLALAAALLLRVGTAAGAEPASASAQAKVGSLTAPGALVIAGGGGLPASVRDTFWELAGGGQARLVIIPTASELADRPEELPSLVLWQPPQVASVVVLHTHDRTLANDPAFIKPLTQATGVWLSGGDQSRLTATYAGTAVERELHRLLARGGVIGGTSAGAAVMSSVMITGGTTVAETSQGFGFLPDVVVDMHFSQRQRLQRLLGVLNKFPADLGLGIDEQTAVVVRGHNLRVIGNDNVRICEEDPSTGEAPDIEVLKAGDQVDLLALTQALVAHLRLAALSPAAGRIQTP